MVKKHIILSICAVSAFCLCSCGKINKDLHNPTEEFSLETNPPTQVYEGITEVEKDTEAKEYLFQNLDEYINHPEVQKELRTIKSQINQSGGTLEIITDYDLIEYRFTFNTQLTSGPDDVAKARQMLENEFRTLKTSMLESAGEIFDIVALDRIIIIISYYDKDGTNIFYEKNDYSRRTN